MASKEAVFFVVDCNQSMRGDKIELAKEAVKALMVQRMVQSKTHEMGVVLFGLPKEETQNTMNTINSDEYYGINEFCRLEQGSTKTLRKLREIGVPDLENDQDAHGDWLDAVVVGVHTIRRRINKRKYLKSVYIVSDCVTPVEGVDQLQDVVGMYTHPDMNCKLHLIGFGQSIKTEGGAGSANASVRDQNEKMMSSAAAATGGTVCLASTVVDVIGTASIKTVNPTLAKVDLCIGTKLAIHCRYFKKTDTSLGASLKKESIPASIVKDVNKGPPAAADGRVRTDRVYRDPEMPDVEIDFVNQVKGYRFGQDYIPVSAIDAELLKLPVEPPAIKVLGFVAAAAIPRHLYMDDTLVVMAEPGSLQSGGAIGSLARALRALKQVAVVRFVRPSSRSTVSEPWLGVLMPDNSGATQDERFIFQKLPFSEDLRDFTFPSFLKAPSTRKPSEAQMGVSEALVDAMMIPPDAGEGLDRVREGLVLNPVKQAISQLKVARALDSDSKVPDLHPSVKAGITPDPEVLDRAAPVFKKYVETFQFEQQERAKAGTSKKRVTYFSDLTLADPDSADGESAFNRAAKRSRSDQDGDEGDSSGVGNAKGKSASNGDQAGTQAVPSDVPSKVGSINPVSDFEKMMAAARDADGEGAALADRAVEQMQGLIHTLVRKGTTTALRAKSVSCLKAFRRASVSHFMGKRYNEYLEQLKEKYQQGDNSDFWQMAEKEKDVWPVTSAEDGSLDMTAEAAEALMITADVKEQQEEADDGGGDDGDLDDMA